jgi:hypothetical protein
MIARDIVEKGKKEKWFLVIEGRPNTSKGIESKDE